MTHAAAPQQLGKYQIRQQLGAGGFATIYQALDTTLDREVALQVLHPHWLTDDTFVQRFKNEGRVSARLFHPNIATVFEISEATGRLYIAMRYIPGYELARLRDFVRERGPLPFEQITAIIRQIGATLDYAHSQGAIHRDVKPSNIIVDDEGHATLTDFGIAKALAETGIHTVSGEVLGIPYYASPEQVRSEKLDSRTDLYSLGVVAYELCIGEVPFTAESTTSLFYKIVHEDPLLPSRANPRSAGPLEQVLLKAIARQPEERYQSGEEFASALDDAIQHIRGEQIQRIYEEVRNLFASGNLDLAEDRLQHILAVRPDHHNAQELVKTIARRRELLQRYQALVDLVEQARIQAQALKADGAQSGNVFSIILFVKNYPEQ